MGDNSTASGSYSTATGFNTEANGTSSFSMGYQTEASDFGSLVIDTYNSIGNAVTTNGSASAFDVDNSAFVIGNGSLTAIHPYDDDEVNLGSASYRFSNIYSVNNITVSSDLRLKKQIKKSDLGLAFINELNPVSYHWKKNYNGKHYGLIAQELLGVFQKHGIQNVDEIATLDWDAESDRYGLRYAELISPMIKAVQEQQDMIESQQDMIKGLKSNFERLEKLILVNR